MSGHSKWHNIQAKKGKADAQRGAVFTKIGREIAIAVREGGANPESNGKLRDIIAKAKERGVNLVLSTDEVAADAFANDANTQIVDSMNIPEGWSAMDCGPKSREAFAAVVKGSNTILWNGPCGVFEMDNFDKGSRALADAVVEATKNGAYSLIGGGDTVSCINKFGLADKVSYVSTGGGALLEAIEGKVLPGIAAIQK